MNLSPNTFIGVLGLLVVGGMLADVLSSKNTAADVTSLSNGWASVEKAALSG
jgi:hypothetical protein